MIPSWEVTHDGTLKVCPPEKVTPPRPIPPSLLVCLVNRLDLQNRDPLIDISLRPDLVEIRQRPLLLPVKQEPPGGLDAEWDEDQEEDGGDKLLRGGDEPTDSTGIRGVSPCDG